jgi:aminopeptidase N
VRLSQDQYRTIDQPAASTDAAKRWRVPVCVGSGRAGETPRCTLLEEREGRLVAGHGNGGRPCPRFIYPNADEGGYFRVAVRAADLAQLKGPALQALPERERAGLVNNAWAAVWSGELHVPELLSFLRGFGNENSRLVWLQIIDSLAGVDRGLISEAAGASLSRLTRQLLGPVGRRLGWAPAGSLPASHAEPDDDKLLRESVLLTLGGLGDDPRVLAEARKRAAAWLDGAEAVPADVARVALPLAARKGNTGLFDRLLAVLQNPATPEIRLLALAGLCGFEEPALVRRTLDLTLDGTIRAQDLRYVFGPLTQRRATRETTFAWIEAHFDELAPRLPSSQVSRFLRLAGTLCDADRVRALQTFLAPRVARLEGTAKDMRQAAEEGLRCATLAGRERETTSAWLRQNAGR